MSMEHWWNENNKGNHNCSEKNLFHCHFVHQIPTWANLGPDPRPVFVVDKVLL